jgi:hypothetical protein
MLGYEEGERIIEGGRREAEKFRVKVFRRP